MNCGTWTAEGYDVRHLAYHQLGLSRQDAGRLMFDGRGVQVRGTWVTRISPSDLFPTALNGSYAGLRPGAEIPLYDQQGDYVGTVTVPESNCVNLDLPVWKESKEKTGRL